MFLQSLLQNRKKAFKFNHLCLGCNRLFCIFCKSWNLQFWVQDLWNSRRCLSKIEEFEHSAVNNTLGACGELPEPQEGPCLPYFCWQCGEYKVIMYMESLLWGRKVKFLFLKWWLYQFWCNCKFFLSQKLSDTITVMEFDFLKPISKTYGKTQVLMFLFEL